MKKYIIFITFILLLGCEKDIILDDYANAEQKLVLNSVPNNITSLKVGIYTTAPGGKVDSTNLHVDAVAELYEDEQFVGKLTFDTAKQIYGVSPFYTIDYTPQIGHSYKIVAQSGELSASAAFTIQEPVKIISATTTLDTSKDNEIDLTVEFQDPDTTNYYIILGYTWATSTEQYFDTNLDSVLTITRHGQYFFNFTSDEQEDILFGDFDLGAFTLFDQKLFYGYITRDDKFNGQLVKMQLYDFLYDELTDWDSTITVALITIPENSYKYFSNLQKQELSRDNPFLEPVNVYTNVENGLGAVVPMYIDTLRTKLKIIN